MYKAIIFDKDGVLVDSELGKMDAMNRALLEFGYGNLDGFEEWFLSRVGVPGLKSCEMFKSKFGIYDLDAQKLYDRTEKIRKIMIVKEPAPFIESSIEFLRSIPRDRFRIGISSSDFRDNIEKQLGQAGILDYFDAITSGEKSQGEVRRDKPFPDIYLFTAEKLSVEPKYCIGIEDTDAGIQAVKSAGMFCVALKNKNSGNQTLRDANLVLSDLRKLNLDDLVSVSF